MDSFNDSVPESPSKLEYDFLPPQETKFRPPFAPTLPSSAKTFKIWEAKDERVGMFRGWQFVFLVEAGAEANGDVKALVERGGAASDVFDTSSAPAKLRAMLTANKTRSSKSGKGTAIIGDVGSLKASAGDAWEGLDGVLRRWAFHSFSPMDSLFIDCLAVWACESSIHQS